MLTFDKVHNPLRLPGETTSKRPNPWCFSHLNFEMCFAPQWRALFRHLNFQKWSKKWCALYILTSKCASRQNGAHFFDISTFNFQNWLEPCGAFSFFTCKCASRHKGAHFFRHLNFQNWLEPCGAFSFFTCKCASRHKGAHFFDISTSKAGPKVRCF